MRLLGLCRKRVDVQLQPVFEQGAVPQLAAVEAGEMLLRLGQQAIDVSPLEQSALGSGGCSAYPS